MLAEVADVLVSVLVSVSSFAETVLKSCCLNRDVCSEAMSVWHFVLENIKENDTLHSLTILRHRLDPRGRCAFHVDLDSCSVN